MELRWVDRLAAGASPLHRADGRLKTWICLGTVATTVALSHLWAEGLVLTSIVLLTVLARIPWRLWLRRLYIPFGVAWLVVLTQALLQGETSLATWKIDFLTLHLYQEGLLFGVLVGLRILTAVSAVTLLSVTTPMVEILASLRSLGIPPFVLDVAFMTYRYLFLLLDESHRMRLAMDSRAIQDSWRTRVEGLGALAGMVFLRAYDRSLRIHQAMEARGYDERSHFTNYFASSPLGATVYGSTGVAAFLLSALLLADNFH